MTKWLAKYRELVVLAATVGAAVATAITLAVSLAGLDVGACEFRGVPTPFDSSLSRQTLLPPRLRPTVF